MNIKYYYNFTDEQMEKYGETLQPLMDKLYEMEEVDNLLEEKFNEWTDKNDELASDLSDHDLMAKGMEQAVDIFEEEAGMEIDREKALDEIYENGFYLDDHIFDIMEEKNITAYDHYHTSIIHHKAYSVNEDVYDFVRELADTDHEVWGNLKLIMQYSLLESCMNGYGVSGDYLVGIAEEDEEEFESAVEAMIDEIEYTTKEAKTLIEEVDKNFIKVKKDLDEVVNEVVLSYYSTALGRLETLYDIEVAV